MFHRAVDTLPLMLCYILKENSNWRIYSYMALYSVYLEPPSVISFQTDQALASRLSSLQSAPGFLPDSPDQLPPKVISSEIPQPKINIVAYCLMQMITLGPVSQLFGLLLLPGM